MTNTEVDMSKAIRSFETDANHQRIGHNAYRWFARLTPGEYWTLLEHVFPHMELNQVINVSWSAYYDEGLGGVVGDVTLEVFDDNGGEVLVDVAQAYCLINNGELPLRVIPEIVMGECVYEACVRCDLDVEVWSDSRGVYLVQDRAGSVYCSSGERHASESQVSVRVILD